MDLIDFGDAPPFPDTCFSGEGDLLLDLSFPLLPESDADPLTDLEAAELEPPPNILFSRPPCEERLRRLLPARLIVGGRVEGARRCEKLPY